VSGQQVSPRLAVCVMGPTATGKSALGLALAEQFDGEIISVDSALVYRGMDIGTAKPSPVERARLPHHLIDIVDPDEHYSAGRFRIDALAAMEDSAARGRLPLLVGGTLLYFRALLQGLSPLPPRDPALRARLEAEAASLGWPAMHRRLAEIDPAAAAGIQVQDRQRIQRALELVLLTGQAPSQLRGAGVGAPAGWDFLTIGLVPSDRCLLADRISRRFAHMMERGLLHEVSSLCSNQSIASAPAMRAVGYRQLMAHLAGEVSLEQACERAIAATRQLAKRQLSWLRGERLDLMVDPLVADPIPAAVRCVATALRRGS